MNFSIDNYNSGRYITTTKQFNEVRILCVNRRAEHCIVALVKSEGFEHLYTYLPNGMLFDDEESPFDLILLER